MKIKVFFQLNLNERVSYGNEFKIFYDVLVLDTMSIFNWLEKTLWMKSLSPICIINGTEITYRIGFKIDRLVKRFTSLLEFRL